MPSWLAISLSPAARMSCSAAATSSRSSSLIITRLNSLPSSVPTTGVAGSAPTASKCSALRFAALTVRMPTRLAGGSTEGIGVSGFDVGCSEAQQAEDRGKQGYCGNVRKEPLTAGKYAFFIPGPLPAAPKSIAVLEVLP